MNRDKSVRFALCESAITILSSIENKSDIFLPIENSRFHTVKVFVFDVNMGWTSVPEIR